MIGKEVKAKFAGIKDAHWQVINTVRAEGVSSRSQLVDGTGLAWGTISGTVNNLLQRELLVDRGRIIMGRGRRSELSSSIGVNPDAGFFLGIAIGKDLMRPALIDFDFRERELNVEIAPVGHDFESFLKSSESLVRACLEQIPQDHLLGIGFTWPGAVDMDRKIIGYSPIIPFFPSRPGGTYSFYISEVGSLKQDVRHNIPVIVESDMHAIVLAEKEIGGENGRRRKENQFVCVVPTDYLRMGLMLGDGVYRGSQNAAGWMGGESTEVDDQVLKAAILIDPGIIIFHGIEEEEYNRLYSNLVYIKHIRRIYEGSIVYRNVEIYKSRLGLEAPAIGVAISAYQQFSQQKF